MSECTMRLDCPHCLAQEMTPKAQAEWLADCMKWRGRPLTGKYGHWCNDWDLLPIDETCPEWPCVCARELEAKKD